MKIVLIASETLHVPPVKGGAIETWVYEVAKRLVNDDVFCLSFHDPLLERYQKSTKPHILTYKKGLLGKILLCTWKLPFKKSQSILYYLPYSFWCALWACRIKADIIHVQTRPQFIPVLRLFNPKAKIILHLHNVSAIDRCGKLWDRSLFDKIDLLVTCSEYLKKEVLAQYPYLENKAVVLYNGVDIERFDSVPESTVAGASPAIERSGDNKETVLLFMGRLVEYKGIHVLIEAFKNLSRDHSAIRLFIVGGHTYSNNEQTPYVIKLKELASEHNNIIFTGYVDHSAIPGYIRSCDIVVVPSLWEEPFGVVTIEAMAMGRTVVAFKKGGIKEIISNGKTGILVEDATAQGLAQSLSDLIDSPDRRKELGQNARLSVVERFSWPRIASDVSAIYATLISNSNL